MSGFDPEIKIPIYGMGATRHQRSGGRRSAVMEYGCQGGIGETTKTANKTRRVIVEELLVRREAPQGRNWQHGSSHCRSQYAAYMRQTVLTSCRRPKKIIEAVALREKLHAEGKKGPTRNPCRRPWGLQRDGDLREQAWRAIQKGDPSARASGK